MIRLDDLIPKQDVTGGHHLLFGDTTQTNNPTKDKVTNMQDKKKKNIKVRDLKPRKDAKGGIGTTAPKNVNTPHGISGPGHGLSRPGNPNT